MVKDSKLYNNVLYRNQLTQEGDGELLIQYASDNTIKNNIIVAGEQGILYASWSGDVNNTFDFNCYFLSEHSKKYPFFVNNEGYPSFKDYSKATTKDKNSIFVNPHFFDENGFDFSLQEGSPCIDTGTDVGLAFDGKSPDIGAIEWVEREEIAGAGKHVDASEKKRGKGVELRPGMTIALEPMVLSGGAETQVLEDQWTVASEDGRLTAHFEHTVAVTENGPWILTALDEELDVDLSIRYNRYFAGRLVSEQKEG